MGTINTLQVQHIFEQKTHITIDFNRCLVCFIYWNVFSFCVLSIQSIPFHFSFRFHSSLFSIPFHTISLSFMYYFFGSGYFFWVKHLATILLFPQSWNQRSSLTGFECQTRLKMLDVTPVFCWKHQDSRMVWTTKYAQYIHANFGFMLQQSVQTFTLHTYICAATYFLRLSSCKFQSVVLQQSAAKQAIKLNFEWTLITSLLFDGCYIGSLLTKGWLFAGWFNLVPPHSPGNGGWNFMPHLSLWGRFDHPYRFEVKIGDLPSKTEKFTKYTRKMGYENIRAPGGKSLIQSRSSRGIFLECSSVI